MIEIKRKVLGTFPLYTEEEAKIKGIKYINWYEAKQAGVYCVSDDGYVGMVIKIYKLVSSKIKNYAAYEIVLPYGRFKAIYKGDVLASKQSCNVQHRLDKNGSFSRASAETWGESLLKKRRIKKLCSIIAFSLSKGSLDYEVLGKMIDKNAQNYVATAKRFLKQKEVMAEVEKSLKEKLSKLGINEEFVINVIKEAVEISRNKKDAKNLLASAKQLREMLGMREGTQTPERMVAISATMEKIEGLSDNLSIEDVEYEDAD